MDTELVFASWSHPGQRWEQGVHIRTGTDNARPVTPAERSGLFAMHRRVAAQGGVVVVQRTTETSTIFNGLGCPPDFNVLLGVPLIHRTRQLWGELVIAVRTETSVPAAVVELVQVAGTALENAQRLAFARRDQDRLLLLAEATNDALYDWDLDRREFWWGGGILKLLGAEHSSVENTVRWKYDQIHPDDADRVRQSFEAACNERAMTWLCEYRFRRHDGGYIQVEDRGYLLRDVAGTAYRVIGSLHDVTAIKEALQREQEARAAAEAASRAKDEFLAMLGHELRNPLAPIVAGLKLLQLRELPQIEREVEILQRQAQHMIRLVDDLLDISRIAHSKIELKHERLELGEVVTAAVETARSLIESKSHTLRVDVPATGLPLDADRSRIAQVIVNVLTNAAKYTEPGGTIDVTAERDAIMLALRVKDTGIGIHPDMLPRVFEAFAQERQAIDRAQGGLGLGLSIVRSLVVQHGGSVSAASAGPGQGSEFIIRLPAAQASTSELAPATPPAEALATTSRRILIVDDNVDAAELLSILLERYGHATSVVNDARSALDISGMTKPEVAILDIGLPDMDGYELARQMRARPDGKRVKLIALTGYGQSSDRARAREAGFDAHLVKPVQIDALATLLQQLHTTDTESFPGMLH